MNKSLRLDKGIVGFVTNRDHNRHVWSYYFCHRFESEVVNLKSYKMEFFSLKGSNQDIVTHIIGWDHVLKELICVSVLSILTEINTQCLPGDPSQKILKGLNQKDSKNTTSSSQRWIMVYIFFGCNLIAIAFLHTKYQSERMSKH